MYKITVIVIFTIIIQNCWTSEEEEWLRYKEKFNKHYGTFEVEQKCKQIMLKNLEEINKHNELFDDGRVTFKLALNEFSDMEEKQLNQILTTDEKMLTLSENLKYSNIPTKNATLRGLSPKYVNWVERGFNTTVQKQGSCNCCYSFASAAAIEAHYYIKYGTHIKLSEQDIVDCSVSYGNLGCTLGWAANVFKYGKKKGIAYAKNIPYKGKVDVCKPHSKPRLRLQNFYSTVSGNEKDLKRIVATVGPVAVAIDASHKTFTQYSSGIYYEPKCSSINTTHIVLVVGYGTLNGHKYWLIKNSWGTSWGEGGYGQMARNRNNNCAIASFAVYPVV